MIPTQIRLMKQTKKHPHLSKKKREKHEKLKRWNCDGEATTTQATSKGKIDFPYPEIIANAFVG